MAPAYVDWDVYGTTAVDRYNTSLGVRELDLALLAENESSAAAVSGLPLVGTGTMHLRAASGGLLVLPTYPGATATERGITNGKIRTVLRWNFISGITRFGLISMQSTINLVEDSGDAYVCVFDNLSFSNTIRIGKMTGTTIGDWTTKVSSSSGQYSTDVSLTVEFEWDASSEDRCILTVRTGSLIDFSDLSTLISYTDTSSPLTTSVAEGIWGYPTSGAVDTYWDKTTIYKRNFTRIDE